MNAYLCNRATREGPMERMREIQFPSPSQKMNSVQGHLPGVASGDLGSIFVDYMHILTRLRKRNQYS